MVSTPQGIIKKQAKKFEEDRLIAKIDLEEVRKARFFSSFRDHNRDFHKLLSNL